MEMQNSKKTVHQRLKDSVSFKVIIIAILILLLLIPMGMIKSIITEREYQRESAIQEVSNKWAGGQCLKGPILTIPIVYETVINETEKGKKVKTVTNTYKKSFHILPEAYDVKGKINPKTLRRGIYEIVVYESDIKTNGNFKIPKENDFAGIKHIDWKNAFVTIGINDLKGIKNQLLLNWGGKKLNVLPGSSISKIIGSGVTVPLKGLEEFSGKSISFNFDLNLQGSQEVSFVPVGEVSTVEINSPWTSPSFFGNFLPDSREISEKGFYSKWKILQLNRNFSQSWFGDKNGNLLQKSAFGVNLKLPVDDYQKSIRSAKYALLILGLTFLIFFLVEVLNNKKIHPLQYILVGLALCVFYVLLVSISEHLNFNKAYLISSFSVISLISMYASSVIKYTKITILITSVLSTLYAFVYVILQLTDYSLLIGSIGLIITLGLTMFFTRKIDWYKVQLNKQDI